jgi:hypothetical protein
MNEHDERLLEKYGWNVICYSPFEIETKDGSFASGEAAQYVLDSIRKEEKENVNKIIKDRSKQHIEKQMTFDKVDTLINALEVIANGNPVSIGLDEIKNVAQNALKYFDNNG